MRVAALLILAGALAGAASPRSPSPIVHPTSSIALKGGYTRLVADGRRAAVVAGCGIVLWKVGQRKGTLVQPCRPARGVDFSGTDEVALAGSRLAWMREEWVSHGQRVQTELVVKDGAGKAREIANAYSDSEEGGWLLTLAGAGDTLAFGSTFDSFDDPTNPIHEEHVFRVLRAGGSQCPHEPGLLPNPLPARLCVEANALTYAVRSVSAGRILVSFAGFQQVGVVERDNSEHDLSIPATQKHLELALSGTEVVVLQAGGTTLDVYDAESGALRRRLPIARVGTVTRLSVAGGFAAFASRGIHLIRLSNGSERSVLAPNGKPPIAATLTSAGLFLLYRINRHERLGFVPMAVLAAT